MTDIDKFAEFVIASHFDSFAWLLDARDTTIFARWAVKEIKRLRRQVEVDAEFEERSHLHWKCCIKCGLTWMDPLNEIPCPRCEASRLRADSALGRLRERAMTAKDIEELLR